MFHILDLYEQPYDPLHPLVCFDEKSKELHAEVRSPIRMQPGQATRQDYEYKRNGTRNLFMFVEPKAGSRHVLITRRRTKLEFAYAMRYLVDILYPDAEWIDVVLDGLNTHHEVVLIEILGKAEADRILSRLRFHHTPAHASWLNMAEIEIGVLEGQCLDCRIPDEFTLGTEVVAWEDRRNQQQAKICWTFTRQKAEKVFRKDQSYLSS
jgi:DDE superfamily endonuclease